MLNSPIPQIKPSQAKINGYDAYLTENLGEGDPAVLGYSWFITNENVLLYFQTSTNTLTDNTLENKILTTITLLPDQPKFHTFTSKEVDDFPIPEQSKFEYKKDDTVWDNL